MMIIEHNMNIVKLNIATIYYNMHLIYSILIIINNNRNTTYINIIIYQYMLSINHYNANFL